MSFFSHENTVGLIISSWLFILAFAFISIDMVVIFVSRVELIHKLVIYFRLKRKLKKIIPYWWSIKEIDILTISKRDGKIEVYVKVSSKISPTWTNDFIEVDNVGNILESTLLEDIRYYDEESNVDTKKLLRDKTLENLGIN